MSKVNLKRLIRNIKTQTNVYTPLVESIVNAIEAIDDLKKRNGEIVVTIIRDNQGKMNFDDDGLSDIVSFVIEDNGVGFTKKNRDSFDTLYSDFKIKKGGKGFGRFTFLKYFDDVKIESCYKKNNEFFLREFSFGINNEIINDEIDKKILTRKNTGTKLYLTSLKKSKYDKKIETIARKLLEKLLVFFVDDNYSCPKITIKENEGDKKIILNDLLLKENEEIKLVESRNFELIKGDLKEQFVLKIFKIYYSTKHSSISLTADHREVTETPLHNYVPEFITDFFDIFKDEKGENREKNYMIKSYVIGEYLNKNVSLERVAFEFPPETDIFSVFSQLDIEKKVAEITKDVFKREVLLRQEKKINKIKKYVNNEAPWHKAYLKDFEYSNVAYNINEEGIELELQKVKFQKEQTAKEEIKKILSNTKNKIPDLSKPLSTITDVQKSDLAHYVYNRKIILELFKKFLQRNDDGKASLEQDIHNLIFPMGKDSTETKYSDHNLWVIDERLVFSEFIASDKKISKTKSLKEPDLVIFDQKKAFRNGDNEFSNPLTIFEFKRPKRNEYAQNEDPILQIAKYLKDIKDDKYETPKGVERIKVNDCTPVYGYVICDITPKIKEFAKTHQLTLSPDEEGYFGFHNGYRMYIEIISFKKLLKDSELRNKIFFKKLGIV